MTNHDAIRRWADETDARPARVKVEEQEEGEEVETDEANSLRFEVAGEAGDETLEEISWNEWFRAFDEQELALVVSADGAADYKLVARSEIIQPQRGTPGAVAAGRPQTNRPDSPRRRGDPKREVEEEEDEGAESEVLGRGGFGDQLGTEDDEDGEPNRPEQPEGEEEEEVEETAGRRTPRGLEDRGDRQKSARRVTSRSGNQAREATPPREPMQDLEDPSRAKGKDKNRNRPKK